MPKFIVTFSKEWVESGTAEVEAKDAQEARRIAEEMALDGSDAITWDGSNMDPGRTEIEMVKPQSKLRQPPL